MADVMNELDKALRARSAGWAASYVPVAPVTSALRAMQWSTPADDSHQDAPYGTRAAAAAAAVAADRARDAIARYSACLGQAVRALSAIPPGEGAAPERQLRERACRALLLVRERALRAVEAAHEWQHAVSARKGLTLPAASEIEALMLQVAVGEAKLLTISDEARQFVSTVLGVRGPFAVPDSSAPASATARQHPGPVRRSRSDQFAVPPTCSGKSS